MLARGNTENFGESDIAVAGRVREYLRTLEVGAKFNSVEIATLIGGASVDAVSSTLSKLTTKNKLSRHRRKVKNGGIAYSYTLLTHDFGIMEGRPPGCGGQPGRKVGYRSPPDPIMLTQDEIAPFLDKTMPKPTSSLAVVADKLSCLVNDLVTLSNLPLSALLHSISTDDLFNELRRRLK